MKVEGLRLKARGLSFRVYIRVHNRVCIRFNTRVDCRVKVVGNAAEKASGVGLRVEG